MPASLVKHQRQTLTDQRRGNGNLLLKYCHGVALQKHNQELEIYKACNKYDTSQVKLTHTTKFSLNPLSLLIPLALYSVCSLSDPFPSVISKEQMGVLHTHSPRTSVKTSSEYLWPPVRSFFLSNVSVSFFCICQLFPTCSYFDISHNALFPQTNLFPSPETSPWSMKWPLTYLPVSAIGLLSAIYL